MTSPDAVGDAGAAGLSAESVMVTYAFARKAEQLLAKDHLDAAQALLQKGLEEFPEYPTGYQLLGDLHRRRGNDISATFAYLEALRRDPDNALTLLRLGDIFRSHGQLQEADKYYQSAARVDFDSPVLGERLGESEPGRALGADTAFMTETAADLYLRQGHSERAKAIYLYLIRQNPHDKTLQEKLRECDG